jgi:beta-lactamase superfamily II metal-dependent hydrolase
MLEVYTYNAGKGDCLRIRFGQGHNMLIDTGVMRFGIRLKEICEEIQSSGETLDVLILTHVDDDHIGGILSLLRSGWKCPFLEVRMNHSGLVSPSANSNAYLSTAQNDEVYQRLASQNVQILPMLAGHLIFVDKAKIITISPKAILTDNIRANTPLAYQRDYGKSLSQLASSPIRSTDRSINNKNSIIFIFEYEGRRLLFTGDAWAEDLVCGLGHDMQHFDLVKLPHHGSAGNISADFKNHINCSNFLICTDGVAHPDKQTIAKLASWYGKINIFSPSDWWSRGFFTSEDDTDLINLIHREGLAVKWHA